MTNADIARIINSNEIQSVLTPRKEPATATRQRKNPLKNNSVLGRLCPWAVTQKKIGALAHKKGSSVQKAMEKKKIKKGSTKKSKGAAKKAFYKALVAAHEAPAAKEEA